MVGFICAAKGKAIKPDIGRKADHFGIFHIKRGVENLGLLCMQWGVMVEYLDT